MGVIMNMQNVTQSYDGVNGMCRYLYIDCIIVYIINININILFVEQFLHKMNVFNQWMLNVLMEYILVLKLQFLVLYTILIFNI